MSRSTERAVERVHPPRWLISHLVNPVARRVLRRSRGSLSENLLLLRFTERKSGRSYEIPVGYRRMDGRLALFSNSGWRHNFRGGTDVEITLNGEPVAARAALMDDAQEVARIYERLIDDVGVSNASRQLGIEIHVDRKPTVGELAGMAQGSGLSVIWLDLRRAISRAAGWLLGLAALASVFRGLLPPIALRMAPVPHRHRLS